MITTTRVLAIDGITDRIPRTCTHCGKSRSRDDFGPMPMGRDGFHPWCRQCLRITSYEYSHSEKGHAVQLAYRNRPEVAERRKACKKAWDAAHPGKRAEYQRTPRARLLRGLNEAKRRLARTTTDARRKRITATVAMYVAELARMDAGHVLPAEPRGRKVKGRHDV